MCNEGVYVLVIIVYVCTYMDLERIDIKNIEKNMLLVLHF